MLYKYTLKDSKTTSPIFLVLTDESGTELVIATPLRALSAKWDHDKGMPKNMYEKTYKRLNLRLDRIKIGVAEYLREKEQKKQPISKIAISRLIRKYAANTDFQYAEGTLLRHLEDYITKRGHFIAANTRSRYMVFLRLLERFEGYQRKHYLLDDISSTFVKEFLNFGSNEKYSTSTIHRTIDFVRTVLNHLEKRGIRTLSYELEVSKRKSPHQIVTLNEDELIKIRNTVLPDHLNAARDWLVLSCYLGQRVSDLMRFNIEMLEMLDGLPCLSFVQQKTQKEILLPLHPVALDILSKNNQAFPPRLSKQKYNEQIKQVVQLANINSLVKVRKRKGYRGQEMVIQKWQAITSHIGRRSFASNFYGKIPTALLMEATGHSTEQMFNRYISSADTERTRALMAYFYDDEKAEKSIVGDVISHLTANGFNSR